MQFDFWWSHGDQRFIMVFSFNSTDDIQLHIIELCLLLSSSISILFLRQKCNNWHRTSSCLSFLHQQKTLLLHFLKNCFKSTALRSMRVTLLLTLRPKKELIDLFVLLEEICCYQGRRGMATSPVTMEKPCHQWVMLADGLGHKYGSGGNRVRLKCLISYWHHVACCGLKHRHREFNKCKVMLWPDCCQFFTASCEPHTFALVLHTR